MAKSFLMIRKQARKNVLLIKNKGKESKESNANPWEVEVNTPDDLHKLIMDNLEVDGMPLNIPRTSVCPCHNAPFDYVADTFFEKVDDCIIIANRNGGKTIIFASVEFVDAAKKGVETCHLAPIMAQSKRAYKYIGKWSLNHEEDLKITKSTITETIFSNGGFVEIITATPSGVNSPHPHKTRADEFELLDDDVFQEALSMAKSSRGISAATQVATTRKYPSGNAQKMIESADERGFKIYKWCIFEVMTPCDCKGETCDEKYNKYFNYDRNGKKITWPQVCQGKAKRCSGYFKFEDVIKKFRSLMWEVFDAQWLCNKPERAGVVYSMFSDDENVIGTMTDDEIIEKLNSDEGWYLGRGWDFGYNDPTVCLWFLYQEDGDIIQFDEYIKSEELIEDFAEKVNERSGKIESDRSAWLDWGDPAGHQRNGISGKTYINSLFEHDIFVESMKSFCIDGIQEQQKMFNYCSVTGKRRKFITRNCKKTIEAFQNAQWDRSEGKKTDHSKEKYLDDKYSHPLDADRYFTYGISQGQIDISY